MLHDTPYVGAGQTVTVAAGPYEGQEYVIEDYWDRVSGGVSWMDMAGNAVCDEYALHGLMYAVPMNDEVVYGKIGTAAHLVSLRWLP